MNDNSIVDVIDILRQGDFLGAGPATEIAKGRYEWSTSWSTFKSKMNRIIKSKR